MRDHPKPPFAGQRQDLPGGLMIDAGDPGPDVLAHVTTGGGDPEPHDRAGADAGQPNDMRGMERCRSAFWTNRGRTGRLPATCAPRGDHGSHGARCDAGQTRLAAAWCP